MGSVRTRESAKGRQILPANGRIGWTGERRAPRPWTKREREHFLHFLASEATLSDALAAADVDRGDAWAERMRNAEFARAWDRCLADRILRLPELLLERTHAILSRDDGSDLRPAASVGQWLIEKCLPLLLHEGAVPRAGPAPAAATVAAPPPPDPVAVDRAIGEQIEKIRRRLEAFEANDPPRA